MTILVTGATGTIGSQVLGHLAGAGVDVKAMTRKPTEAMLGEGVTAVAGELADTDSLRAALMGVDTLFLLSPNVAEELTHSLIALSLAREAGVRGVVYLSVFKAGEFTDVPHFAGKHTVERMIETLDLPATVLRPAYYMQNDLRLKKALLDGGVYPMPVGAKGISMIDTRDLGDAAARELLRRERAPAGLPREVYELVGPDVLTGADLAAIWEEALARPVRYGGDSLDGLEQRLRSAGPSWLAYDLRQMMRRYQEDGAGATPGDIDRLTGLLGRVPRSYRAFAAETAGAWARTPQNA